MTETSALTEYDYSLPVELLAGRPVEPRDSSRLFVYDTGNDQVTLDRFSALSDHLPKRSLLVFNDTKVVPARIDLVKETGGRVECLLLVNEMKPEDKIIRALADRKIAIGQKLFYEGFGFEVVSQDRNVFSLKPVFDLAELPMILNRGGRTPIPKYLGQSGLSEEELRTRYQSVWAKNPASVAAPTASLHFTPEVLRSLQAREIEKAEISLHVGLGTFAPVTPANVQEKRLHKERYYISKSEREKILASKKVGRKIVAVGTTATRALESAAEELLEPGKGELEGETDLFILPPYKFRIIDALITNFHLPQSSLMCLVDAFLRNRQSRRNLLALYDIAIKEKFRFYSFGDAMLIK